MKVFTAAMTALLCLNSAHAQTPAHPPTYPQRFLSGLDSVRIALHIPGMAVAIAQGDSVLLETGLGYADISQQIPVTAATTFRIASITKTFTSTLLLQLVEQGKLNLDEPASHYYQDFAGSAITLRHLLTHTSEGEPGSNFQYNGFRYGLLQKPIEQAAGMPFYALLMEKIVQPLKLNSTAPGIARSQYADYDRTHPAMIPVIDRAFSNLAKPYELDQAGKINATTYLDEFGAFGGLISNVQDLLKYSRAIDRHLLLREATQQQAFTPHHTTNGKLTPYGLGWFVQSYNGTDFYWHYGQTKGESGLFVKVPSLDLTLVVLTNSIYLSNPFPLGDGDLFASPIGQLFYKFFIDKGKTLSLISFAAPADQIRKAIQHTSNRNKGFYNQEIITQAIIDHVKGDYASAKNLYRLYAQLNFKSSPEDPRQKIIASIDSAGINQVASKDFILTSETNVKITGVGENCSPDGKSWCDYGWIENSLGEIVWEMQSQPSLPAGGAIKNQRVEAAITLPAGRYSLKYKSDWGHAYDNWDALPPDGFRWGIRITRP
jgi:CubicO group peptidase (beta-lactamase class C family)